MKTEYKGKRNNFLAKSLKYFFQRQILFLDIYILFISKLILGLIRGRFAIFDFFFSFKSHFIDTIF